MGSKNMLVNVQEDDTRIALTENNRLVDLHIELTDRERTVGNVYKGVVVKVNPAFQAAFVDYGEDKNGFLSISDIDSSLYKGEGGGRGRPKIQSVLKSGQALMVQVLKEGIRQKGAALTTTVSLPGRYLVLTTNSERSGVSRKIDDVDKRGKLKEVLAGLKGDKNQGVIIRTAGIDRSPTELKRDFANLQKDWKSLQSKFTKQKKPGLLHQEPKSLLRVLRDYFSDDVEEVMVDSAEAFQEALKYFKAVLPKFQKRLKLYVGDNSLFSAHNIEPQIAALDSSKVYLASGGGLVIEPTEALVSIDVNSGKSNQASDIETTALNTNLEAAAEVGRQLRLRNLGGLIVVDFIDMTPQKNRDKVEQALADAMKDDKARISIGRISEFGLLELSRQRIDVELSRGSRVRCEACGGTGHVPTANSSANNVLREIRELAASGRYSQIHGELPLEHANFLLNHRRESLRDLELEFDISVHITGNPALPAGQTIKLTGSRPHEEEDGASGETDPEERTADAPEERTADAAAERTAVSVEETEGSDAPAGGRPRRRRRRRGRGGGRDASAEEHPMEDHGSAAAPEAPEEEEETAGEQEEEPLAAAPTPGNGGSLEPANGGGSPARTDEQADGAKRVGLKRARRGDWLGELDSADVSVGSTLFSSGHQPAETSDAPIVQPSFKPSGPFLGSEAEESTTLFESSHRTGENAEAPAEKKKAKSARGSSRASSSGKSRAGAGKARGAASRGRKAGKKPADG